MTKKELRKVTKIAEGLGWCVTQDGEDFSFQKYSPAGQDFNFEVSADDLEELHEKINEYYENFDCSYEAYLWLDSSGHGRNGAPDDMKDLYEDMEACEAMIKELADAIEETL